MLNQIESMDKYIQGSIWHWKNPGEQREGVQSGERPVLIISNDIFNKYSYSVNCVSITTVLKDNPVHEPIFIVRPSHIQCEQIHTVPKSELTEYIGAVPRTTLSNVKAKIRIQFNMGEDRNTETLLEIKKTVEMINRKLNRDSADEDSGAIRELLELLHEKTEKEITPDLYEIRSNLEFLLDGRENNPAAKGIQGELQEIAGIFNDGLDNKINTAFSQLTEIIVKTIKSLQYTKNNNPTAEEQIEPDKYENSDIAKPIISQAIYENSYADKPGQRRRVYSIDDKLFIADGRNSIQSLMERYEFTSKQAAYSTRSYIRKALSEAEKI